MTFWSNLLGYQLVWFATVVGVGHGVAWPALVSATVFVGWQMLASKHPKVELRLLLSAVVLGVCVDGVLAASGWAQYAVAALEIPTGGAPIWILALWACFAMTLTQSLRYLSGRPWLALIFGAIGAPMAYLSAARGWHALAFEAPMWRGLTWLACGWAVALWLLATLTHRWAPASERTITAISAETP
jgi:hypothetical protein